MTTSFDSLREAFGLRRAPTEELDTQLQVRVDKRTLSELDALEAFLKGHGFREANRSALIRAALTSYLEGVRTEAPEALIPPSERIGAR